MGDLVPVPRDDLRELLVALRTVSSLIPGLEERLHRPSVRLPGAAFDPTLGEWEVLEEERDPRGLSRADSTSLFSCRIVEDGPPDTPEACFDFVEGALTGCIGSRPGDCVALTDRAFVAGFWAWAAVACDIPYSRALPVGRATAIYIVLRALNCPAPRRVTTREDLIRLVTGDDNAVVEEFGSQAELEVFCSGAQVSVPPLVRWRNRQ